MTEPHGHELVSYITIDILTHPLNRDSQDQEAFLDSSVGNQTLNYETEHMTALNIITNTESF